MIKYAHNTYENVNKVEIQATSGGNYTVWIYHDDIVSGACWLEGDNIEIKVPDVVPVKKPVKLRMGVSTIKRGVELMSKGSFTKKQLSTFLGLTEKSVATLLVDIKRVGEVTVVSERPVVHGQRAERQYSVK
jgi:hypothetical protein